MKKLAIIGYGHMGKALKQGLVRGGFQKEHIFVSNESAENKRIAAKADIIFITVKPKHVYEVLWELRDILVGNIVISAAAAVPLAHMKKATRNKVSRLIRIMPNLPIAYQSGLIGMFASKAVSPAEKKEVTKLLSLLGNVIECKTEKEIDALTVVAGSGPAIAAYTIGMLAKIAKKMGVNKSVVEQVALQTYSGTLTLLKESKQSPIDLQKAVATKGGVTEVVLKDLDEQKLPLKFEASLRKGYDKIETIKDEL